MNIGTKGFWGKILQKWAYFGGNKKSYGSPYLGRILKQKLPHILTSSQSWLIPLVDDCPVNLLDKIENKTLPIDLIYLAIALSNKGKIHIIF
jgi:hypothetical protein